MSNNAQKVHYARTINRFAEQKVLDALQVLGKSLPCHVIVVSGSIVTVRFDITPGTFTLPDVTCPMFGPEYIRYPTQINDLGVVMSADYYIGGVSGLGGSTANLSLRSNLSTLIWFPIANTGSDTNKNWPPTDDPNALVLYGPNGGILRTVDKSSVVTVNSSGITLVSSKPIAVTSDVSITLTAPVINSGS